MKVLAFISILASAAAFSINNRPSLSRRDLLNGATAAVVGATLAQPFDAFAADNIPPITGIYSDPNHKNGYRVVRAVDKSTAVVILQDEPNGPIISVNGKIKTNKKTGTTVTLDLSPKGGPKDVVASVGGSDTLVFPDGNAWTKIPATGIDGLYTDPNHPNGYRYVRMSRNGNINITLQDDVSDPVIELQGKRKGSKGYVFIDFSPKGGPKDLSAIADGNKLTFPDGNAWTKL